MQRSLAGALPPGLARLGLARNLLDSLADKASKLGPASALNELITLGHIERDHEQLKCAKNLEFFWQAAQTFFLEHVEWRSKRVLWLGSLRKSLRELRAEEKERAKRENEARSSPPTREMVAKTWQSRRRQREILAFGRPEKPSLGMQGCYVWGDVGRGKSLLMDLLAVSLEGHAPTEYTVIRQHYHEFMRSVHERLHVLRMAGAAREAVQLVGSQLASGFPAVLLLDEFQVTNIADVVILRSLYESLFKNDVLIVMTSNRPPSDLYKDGLNHMIYMPPFLRLFEERVEVHHLDSSTDYRALKAEQSAKVGAGLHEREDIDYLVPPKAQTDLMKAYARIAECSVSDACRVELAVSWGRKLECSAVHRGVAWFSFEELCCQPLSADDFMSLIERNSVHTFVISGIPCFTLEQHNEARRFTNLIDCLYEHNCRLTWMISKTAT